MQKKIALITLASIASLSANDYTSHTYFSSRPQYQEATPEKLSLFRDRMMARTDGKHGTLQLVPLGGKTTNGDELARFFLPFGKTQIIAGEFNAAAVNDGSVDVIANYFGVLTRPLDQVYPDGADADFENLTFQSVVKLEPSQSVLGMGIGYQQLFSGDEKRGYFFSLHIPIMHIKNDTGFHETVTDPGGLQIPPGYAASMEDALSGKRVFGNKVFHYGKIDPCPRTKTGIADIEVAVGWYTNACSSFYREFYAGLLIPTGNKPTAEYMFEPVVGNNHHVGFFWGSGYRYTFWSHDDEHKKLSINVNTHGVYLFKNTQRRSLDLVDRQWSRYIWMYPDKKATAISDITPGINFLTKQVKVSPRTSHNVNTGIVFTADGFSAEAGYNMYARQAELIELQCPFERGPGIVGIEETDARVFVTKSVATIRKFTEDQQSLRPDRDATGAPRFVPIEEQDINLASTAHPSTIANTFYGVLGYRWEEREYPLMLGAGASYEFSADNAGFERWLVWGKFGISF